jgi:putative phosphoribosyl transferase
VDLGENRTGEEREIHVEIAGARLIGDFFVPPDAQGVVLFAHGSGSSRKSTRNRLVARALQEAGLATLLLDLLTREEERREETGAMLRFDVILLARRLGAAMDWLRREPTTCHLPIGLFGASTGAAAALIAAAEQPDLVDAVVSRGGRPDLALEALEHVQCATRLIVGSADEDVLELNRLALQRMRAEKDLVVVRGATHLFEEPGALQEVARLARGWFVHHLMSAADAREKERRGDQTSE